MLSSEGIEEPSFNDSFKDDNLEILNKSFDSEKQLRNDVPIAEDISSANKTIKKLTYTKLVHENVDEYKRFIDEDEIKPVFDNDDSDLVSQLFAKRATLQKKRGNFSLAARLYLQGADKTYSVSTERQLCFNALSCYIDAKDAWRAQKLAEQLKTFPSLNKDEQTLVTFAFAL